MGQLTHIHTDTEVLASATIERRVRGASASLYAAEFQEGDRVAITAAEPLEQVVALLACWRLGLVGCPLSPRDPETLRAQKVAVLGARVAPPLAQSIPTDDPGPPVPDYDENRDASVIFTSGSSGEPKGVVHTHAAHRASARGANANLPLGPGDRWLLSLPLYHVGGLAILFRCFEAGADLVVPPARYDLAELIARQAVTHLSLVPTQLSRLLEQPAHHWIPSLRGVLLGGGPIPGDLVTAARAAGVPLHTTYGLTEMASQVTCTAPAASAADLATAGQLLAERELTIGPDGEILVRGATLGRCYLDATGESPLLADDGWYHARDAGALDEHGRLTVHGRLDSRFISGGENIQPEAIERVLLDQPGVRRAIVVPRPHPEFGQRPVAYVDGSPGAATLQAAVAARLPRFMVPDAILPWPSDDDSLKPSRTVFIERAKENTR